MRAVSRMSGDGLSLRRSLPRCLTAHSAHLGSCANGPAPRGRSGGAATTRNALRLSRILVAPLRSRRTASLSSGLVAPRGASRVSAEAALARPARKKGIRNLLWTGVSRAVTRSFSRLWISVVCAKSRQVPRMWVLGTSIRSNLLPEAHRG